MAHPIRGVSGLGPKIQIPNPKPWVWCLEVTGCLGLRPQGQERGYGCWGCKALARNHLGPCHTNAGFAPVLPYVGEVGSMLEFHKTVRNTKP